MVTERVEYKTAVDHGLTPDDLHPDTWNDLKGIEVFGVVMEQIPWFSAQLAHHKLSVSDLINETADLESLRTNLDNLTEGRKKRKYFQTLGFKVMGFVDNISDGNGHGAFKTRLAKFMQENGEFFGLEISTSKE